FYRSPMTLSHLYLYCEYQVIHSFPTRRSSDLFEYGKRPNEINSRTVNFTPIVLDCFKIDIFRASSLSFEFVTSSPSIEMIPSSFAINRLIMEISVLFPAPFGPIKEVI